MAEEREEREEKDRGFKVEDKRRFDASGQARGGDEKGQEEERDDARSADAPEHGAGPTGGDSAGDAGARAGAASSRQPESHGGAHDAGELMFSSFVFGLAQQAFVFLGVAPDPQSGVVHKDLDQARAMIDILSMLAAKTRGNLTDDEERMMEELLYELRMTYVRETHDTKGTKETEGHDE